MNAELPREFYTLDEMAEILHKSPWTLYQMTSRQKHGNKVEDLPPLIRCGNRILFPVPAFHKWTEERLNSSGQVRSGLL
jgi:hypothetical protein